MSSTRWSEVTAVLGGTFDPPHLGHREAVRGLFQNPGVRRVIVVPSANPPFKPQAASGEDRFKMAELTFKGLVDVLMDRRELTRAEKNSQPSYTIDTLQDLKKEIPNLAFVMGADQLAQLHSWHRFHDLLNACHWIVLARKPDGEKTAMKTLQEWESSGLVRRTGSEWETTGKTRISLVETDAPDLSSSAVREEIARSTDRQTLENWMKTRVSNDVLAYLMQRRIYGMRPYEHEC